MNYSQSLNPKVLALHKSPTLKITSLAKKMKKEGEDVIIFAAGEPDFDSPPFVKEAAAQALAQGLTKYTPSAGMLELRRAIAEKLKIDNNLDYTPGQILVTAGAKYALVLSLLTLISGPDDEVILPSPYWVSYPEMVTLAGGKVRYLVTEKADDFKITPRLLREAITPHSKVLILNYPNNPSASTYTEAELLALSEVINDSGIYVISDEIYEKIIFDGRAHISFASLPGCAERTLTINGFSKAYSMTGWRLGYVAGPDEVIAQTGKIIDHTTSCTNAFAQAGAIAALKRGGAWCEEKRKEFELRRDFICDCFSSCPQISFARPQGTFYLFCDIGKTGLSSLEFASRLLEEFRVAVIPSPGFGVEGYIRLSFAADTQTIERGTKRIKKFIASL